MVGFRLRCPTEAGQQSPCSLLVQATWSWRRIRSAAWKSDRLGLSPVRASVRRFHSPDVDLEAYQPEDPTDVHVLVQLIAGPEGGPGDESFDVGQSDEPTWRELADKIGRIGRWEFEDYRP